MANQHHVLRANAGKTVDASWFPPIRNRNGETIAALSIPFLATEDDTFKERIRLAALNATRQISQAEDFDTTLR